MAKKHKDAATSDIAALNRLGFSDRFKYGLLSRLVRHGMTPTQSEQDWIDGMTAEKDRLKEIIEQDMRDSQAPLPQETKPKN